MANGSHRIVKAFERMEQLERAAAFLHGDAAQAFEHLQQGRKVAVEDVALANDALADVHAQLSRVQADIMGGYREIAHFFRGLAANGVREDGA